MCHVVPSAQSTGEPKGAQLPLCCSRPPEILRQMRLKEAWFGRPPLFSKSVPDWSLLILCMII